MMHSTMGSGFKVN